MAIHKGKIRQRNSGGTYDYLLPETTIDMVNGLQDELDSKIDNTDASFIASSETESASLGNENVTTSGWITTTGWVGNLTNGFVHTPGNTTNLTFTMPVSTAEKLYEVAFRVESPTPAGFPNASTDFTVSIGNSEPFVTYQGGGNFNYSFGIRSVSDGDLVFIPGTTFDGTIKNVSVKEIVGDVKPSLKVLNGGQNVLEVRTTRSSLQNVFIGKNSGAKNTTGRGNASLGDDSLQSNTTGYWNSALGLESLRDNTTGSRNIALGYVSLRDNISGDRNISIGTFAMHRNTHGRENIAVGADALWYNTVGDYNVAIGHYSMGANIDGEGNVALGRHTLNRNTTSGYNVAIGSYAMERATGRESVSIGRDSLKNATSNQLVAIGTGSLLQNTSGSGNLGVGTSTLRTNTTGHDNTVVGNLAGYGTTGIIHRNSIFGNRSGYASTTGASDNAFFGYKTGETITTGNQNVAIGSMALSTNVTGADNAVVGYKAGNGTSGNIQRNSILGSQAGLILTTNASNNVLIGYKSGETITTGSSNIMIGSNTQPQAGNSANQLNIGNFLYGIMSLKRFGIDNPDPRAHLHLKASDGNSNNASLKIPPGILLSTKEVGAFEFDGTDLYITDNTGKRYKLLKEIVA